MEKVCFIKLINGEDIVGLIDNYETDSDEHAIVSPLRLMYTTIKSYQVMQLGTWMPFNKERTDPFFIQKKHVLYIQEADDDLILHYMEALEEYRQDLIEEEYTATDYSEYDEDDLEDLEDELQLNVLRYSANTSIH